MKKMFYSETLGPITALKGFDEEGDYVIALDFFPNIHAKDVFTTYIRYEELAERDEGFANLTLNYVERIVSSTIRVMRFKD